MEALWLGRGQHRARAGHLESGVRVAKQWRFSWVVVRHTIVERSLRCHELRLLVGPGPGCTLLVKTANLSPCLVGYRFTQPHGIQPGFARSRVGATVVGVSAMVLISAGIHFYIRLRTQDHTSSQFSRTASSSQAGSCPPPAASPNTSSQCHCTATRVISSSHRLRQYYYRAVCQCRVWMRI